MFCNQCGTELKEGAAFCPNCGKQVGKQAIEFSDVTSYASRKLQQGASNIQRQQQEYQAKRKEELEREKISRVEDVFVDSAEEEIAVLGSGYLSNFIHGGGLSKGFGIVSNKRFYFRGKGFFKAGGHYLKTNEERCVDLPDITSSGFVYSHNVILLILAILGSIAEVILFLSSVFARNRNIEIEQLFLCGIVVLCILWVLYFLSRKCIYEIQFAGGCIAVRASKYGIKETKAFDKELRRAKDKAMEVR